MYHYQYNKENHQKLSQIQNSAAMSWGLKNEFEIAVVNEPSVFEPLKFYGTYLFAFTRHDVFMVPVSSSEMFGHTGLKEHCNTALKQRCFKIITFIEIVDMRFG